MRKIKISNKIISQKNSPFLIAEAGINHNGSLKKALKMVDIAKKAGVDAIKFQTYSADELISNLNTKYKYKSNDKIFHESMYDIFKRCELSKSSWAKIKNKCKKKEIIFLSTPSSYNDLVLLLKLNVPAIKVGSDDFNNIPLIEKIKKTKLPMILSSGMSTIGEIQNTLKYAGAEKNYPIILMLCISQYPVDSSDVNISRINSLAYKFPNIILGFSDHTQGSLAACLALALGARCFEKHFTINKSDHGPDHWFSEDPTSLKNWVNQIKLSFKMFGNSKLFPTSKELKMKKIARKSIVASKDIPKGGIINEKNITFKRPGNGLAPVNFKKINGRKTKKIIKKNTQIKLNLLSK